MAIAEIVIRSDTFSFANFALMQIYIFVTKYIYQWTIRKAWQTKRRSDFDGYDLECQPWQMWKKTKSRVALALRSGIWYLATSPSACHAFLVVPLYIFIYICQEVLEKTKSEGLALRDMEMRLTLSQRRPTFPDTATLLLFILDIIIIIKIIKNHHHCTMV